MDKFTVTRDMITRVYESLGTTPTSAVYAAEAIAQKQCLSAADAEKLMVYELRLKAANAIRCAGMKNCN